MRIIKTNSSDYGLYINTINTVRNKTFGTSDISEVVEKIIGDVLFEGDQALIELTKEYDGALLTTDTKRVE